MFRILLIATLVFPTVIAQEWNARDPFQTAFENVQASRLDYEYDRKANVQVEPGLLRDTNVIKRTLKVLKDRKGRELQPPTTENNGISAQIQLTTEGNAISTSTNFKEQ